MICILPKDKFVGIRTVPPRQATCFGWLNHPVLAAISWWSHQKSHQIHSAWWLSPTPLKNDGVSWDDYSIPNMMGKLIQPCSKPPTKLTFTHLLRGTQEPGWPWIHQVTRESEGFFGQEITEEFPAKIHPYSSNLNKDFSIGLMTIPPPKKNMAHTIFPYLC